MFEILLICVIICLVGYGVVVDNAYKAKLKEKDDLIFKFNLEKTVAAVAKKAPAKKKLQADNFKK